MKTTDETNLPYKRPPKGWDPKAEAVKFQGKRFGPTLRTAQEIWNEAAKRGIEQAKKMTPEEIEAQADLKEVQRHA